MALSSRITRNFQITIPKKIRKELPYLKEGDTVDFEIEHNKLFLIPQKKIPADQIYYWSAEWQKGIQEAKEDIKAGRILGPYENIKEALKVLKQPIEDDK